ncbi:MAG: fructose 1,6-bisphosphatase [Methanophagales archaeon]|nr:fructose 1,6-bisphosphatase [Methanophagales archaeon]
MVFTERGSEPLVAYMMDKTEPGAFNHSIFKIFADPFNTAGPVIDPTMHDGFDVWDRTHILFGDVRVRGFNKCKCKITKRRYFYIL